MGFDATVKRHAYAFLALVIVVIAYFQAKGFTQLLAASLSSSSTPAAGIPFQRHYPRAVDTDHETSAAIILSRNAFDSVTGPIPEHPVDLGKLAGVTQENGQDPYADPQCTGARAVLIASSDDPAWSFAAIQGPDGKTVFVRQGEQIAGLSVAYVGDQREPERRKHHDEHQLWDRVWLTSATGGRCQLALGQKPIAAPKGGPAAPPASMPTGGPLAGKIQKIGENEFVVDRTAVESVIANPAELMKARIFPVKDGERIVGMRLLGVKPNTLLGQLGMQNGDVLTSINGFEMNDPQKMLEAYSKLMRADKLTATVVRGGKPVNLEYAIK
jgi:general secretion pathway protein C